MKQICNLFMVFLLVSSTIANAKTSPPPSTQASCININTASQKELTHAFKGVGKQRAQAIINYRKDKGAFTSIADLAKVKSFGKSFVNKQLPELEKVFCVSDKNV